ncbi:MAG: glycosyltransferase family 2 protein [Parachlamydiaceae bacterium]
MLILLLITIPTTIELMIWIIGYFFYKQKPFVKNGSINLAILVPAHNEEKGLCATLDSLKAFNHPIILIADNCTDKTVDIGLKSGVSVIERNDPRFGKPFALQFAFEHLEKMPYTHYLIIDADCTASSNLVEEVKSLFHQGYEFVQVRYTFERNTPFSRLYYLKLESVNHMRPLARMALNLYPGCLGSGFALTKESVKKIGIKESLAEDQALFYDLCLNEISQVFTDKASVTAKAPPDKKAFNIQNQRWDKGRFQLIQDYFVSLIKAKKIELACNLLVLPLSYYLLLLILVLISYPLYSLIGFILVLIHYTQTFFLSNGTKEDLYALRLIPELIFMKIAAIPNLLRTTKWKKTPR